MPNAEVLIPMVARCAERIIDVIFAGSSIWLGFKLFDKAAGELGDVEASKGDIIFKLKRVGPGTLFALFGSVVIGYSIISPLEIKSTLSSNSKSGDAATNSTFYDAGGGYIVNPDQSIATLMNAISMMNHFASLNRMPQSPVEASSFDSAMQTLLSYRMFLIGKMFGKDALDKWEKWSVISPSDPAFLSKLPQDDQNLYSKISDALDVH